MCVVDSVSVMSTTIKTTPLVSTCYSGIASTGAQSSTSVVMAMPVGLCAWAQHRDIRVLRRGPVSPSRDIVHSNGALGALRLHGSALRCFPVPSQGHKPTQLNIFLVAVVWISVSDQPAGFHWMVELSCVTIMHLEPSFCAMRPESILPFLL